MNFAVREELGLQNVGGGQFFGGFLEGYKRMPLAVTCPMNQAIHKTGFRRS